MSKTSGEKLESLAGIGPVRLNQLHKLKLFTVEDLLMHRPRRYEDRTSFSSILEAKKGDAILCRGTVCVHGVKRFNRGRKSVYEFVLDEGSVRLHCRFWNMPFLESQISVGMEVFVFGKVTENRPVTIDHPEFEIVDEEDAAQVHLNRIVPVYRLTEGLPQRWLRKLVWEILDQYESRENQDQLAVSQELGSHRVDDLRTLHFPETMTAANCARRRFALEEFVVLQRGFALRRQRLRANSRGNPCSGDNRLIKPFLKTIGFQLTNAQTSVLREIRSDMLHEYPMRRLLHGDVGSGKTVVAVCAALMVIESGFDVALMAPTEILADQHFRKLSDWLEAIGACVELVTANAKQVSGTPRAPRITIGTHALIHDGYQPENLGLVIIDEQHRFGVIQREQLVRKGVYPHLLVMTATPIPRTLGLTAYGDLDISVLDELPAQRGRVRTHLRSAVDIGKVWDFVADELDKGRQAYVVYPRIEEDARETGLKSVKEEFDRLRDRFAPRAVGLLHGRMRTAEMQEVTRQFRTGEIQLLVSTTVVEVGVDVPNASIMVIENAGQFGLSQLHQLRGRIGRGAADSHCILIEDSRKVDALDRLKVMLETSDGFRIAEEDMRLRGMGDFLGTRQSGMPTLKFGDLINDRDLVIRAREMVERS